MVISLTSGVLGTTLGRGRCTGLPRGLGQSQAHTAISRGVGGQGLVMSPTRGLRAPVLDTCVPGLLTPHCPSKVTQGAIS